MTKKLSIQDLDLRGKRVLMRVDFNVPLDKNLKITDDTRIQAALPSIRYVLDHGGSLVLMSHLGRPKGKPMSEFSLAPCAKRLSELLHKQVIIAKDCVGPDVEKMASDLQPGDVLLLENLRFHRGEEKPEEEPHFVDQLAKLGDVYVNDAFGTAHRAHASTALIAKLFPNKAAAGFLMDKEIQFLNKALLEPKRPLYAIIGGAKISSKIGVLKALLDKVDALFIGGGMAFTFFKGTGIAIGDSIHEDDFVATAKELQELCKQKKVPLYLSEDVVITKKEDDTQVKVVEVKEGIPDGWEGVDIGPKTIDRFKNKLGDAGTVFWNGPLGVFEKEQFAKGTNAVAETLSKLQNAVTIIGGGDSISAINKLGLADSMTHLSTGGGASLEYIENGSLPGIEALSNKGT